MRRVPLVWQIVAGLVLGVLAGRYFNTHPLHRAWVSVEILRPLGGRDSGTTTLNVLGNAIAPLVIARREREEIARPLLNRPGDQRL